jgi:hypothetical protein
MDNLSGENVTYRNTRKHHARNIKDGRMDEVLRRPVRHRK